MSEIRSQKSDAPGGGINDTFDNWFTPNRLTSEF